MSFTCGKDCPCGDGCTNQPLSKRQQAPYKIYWVRRARFMAFAPTISTHPHVAQTGKRGFGLCATAPIKKGEFIMDYRGEVSEFDFAWARSMSS